MANKMSVLVPHNEPNHFILHKTMKETKRNIEQNQSHDLFFRFFFVNKGDMTIYVKIMYICTLVVEDYFQVLPIELMYIPSSSVSATRCSIQMHVATEKELIPRLPRLLVDTVRIYQ